MESAAMNSNSKTEITPMAAVSLIPNPQRQKKVFKKENLDTEREKGKNIHV